MQQTAVRVREIAFMGYPVRDIQRARQFYESLFHLTPSQVGDDGNLVEYDVKGVTFSIGHYEGWDPSPNGPLIAFEVEDLDQSLQVFREKNVPILMEPIETPGCRMMSIGDPDGNSILIHQSKR